MKNYVAPEYCVDTEHKNQDMEFGLQECTSNDDKHEQVSGNGVLMILTDIWIHSLLA